ncbi:hypothetical protein NFI96_024402, partial [Prochilodus magdalenae]
GFKPVLAVEPDWPQIFSGENVTLTCSIPGCSVTDWTYDWYRDNTQMSYSDENYQIIRGINVQSAKYKCCCFHKSGREALQCTDEVTLNVIGASFSVLSLLSSLMAASPYLLVSIVLGVKCYRARAHSNNIFKFTNNTTILGLISDGDETAYRDEVSALSEWCYHNNLSICKTKEMIVDYRKLQRGSPLYINGAEVDGVSSVRFLRLRFYKDHGSLRNVRTQSRLYRRDDHPYCQTSKSDEGLYHCKHPERGESPESWISVTAAESTVGLLIKMAVGASVAVLFIILLPLLCCCKAKKGNQQNVNQTSDQNQRESGVLVSFVQAGHAQGRFVPVLIVQPDWPQIFSGETVTLTCSIPEQRVTDWTYYWYRDNTQLHHSDQNYYTITDIKAHKSLQYYCYGLLKLGQRSSFWSNTVTFTVTERPKASLTMVPTGQMFIGETVTLRCDIQGHTDTGWRYSWYKDGDSNSPVHSSDDKTDYSFSAVDSDSGTYTCRGERRRDSQRSEISNTVTLTVSETPIPELTSSHKGAALIGNPMVLYCKVDQSAGWKFYWSKHTQNPENETETETHTYTFSSVSVSDGGQYWCRAGRGDPVYYTHYSDALWINTTGESPPVSLMVSPSRTQHFTTDPLSLSCDGQSDSTGWRVRQFTHSEEVSDCLSGWRSVTGSTCSISSLSSSHTGVYWCESESGESSNPVNITVHNGSVILESPVHPVTEGGPLTLHCLYYIKPSNLTAEFYKDGSLLQTQTTGEMIIPTVSKSDEGLYHCKHPERGESPQSWISVRREESITSCVYLKTKNRILESGLSVTECFSLSMYSAGKSTAGLVGVAVGASVAVLFIILLILLCCCKAKKGNQQNINQTSDQNQRESGDEESQSGCSPLQSGQSE